jgi:hypothetical protein
MAAELLKEMANEVVPDGAHSLAKRLRILLKLEECCAMVLLSP